MSLFRLANDGYHMKKEAGGLTGNILTPEHLKELRNCMQHIKIRRGVSELFCDF